MAAKDKLLDEICRNPADVRFVDACKAARLLNFEPKSTKGSHHSFRRQGETMLLNFQKNKNGKIPTYQADQLVVMIRKYREQL